MHSVRVATQRFFVSKALWVGDGVRRAGAAFVQECVFASAFLALRAFVFQVRSGCIKLELQNRSRTVSWTSETSSRGVWSMQKLDRFRVLVWCPCHSKKQVEAANMGRGAMK